MIDTAAAPEWLRVAGIVLAAALAGAAMLAPSSRGRAWGMLGALALTPVLLLLQIWDTPQLDTLRRHPAPVLGGGLVVAAAVVVPLAVLFARKPAALAIAVLAALPFRVPIEAGGTTANLLVPLYLVVAAGALAWAVPRVRDGEAFDPPRRNGAMERLLALAVVLYGLQMSYSSDVEKALEQTAFFYVPFALLFAVIRDLDWSPRRLRVGFLVLLGMALVFVAVGFWEYATRTLLFNPKVIASNQVDSYFRVNSLFFDPNIYGRFLALVMLGLAAVLLWERRPRTVWLAVAGLVVLWGGLVLTLSQSSFAALLCGLLVLAALRFPSRYVAPAAAVVVLAGTRARARLPVGAAARPRQLAVARRRDVRALRADPRGSRARARAPADRLGVGRLRRGVPQARAGLRRGRARRLAHRSRSPSPPSRESSG